MLDILEINTWKKSFGLLPIHLNPIETDKKFLMLNGAYGNFCLNFSNEEEDSSIYFSESWSSDTKNYILVKDENVKIYNWIKRNPESINKQAIEENFDKFYTYLLHGSYKTQNDPVPFIIDCFRSLRNLTQESINPKEALNLLFVLLISIEENYNEIDIDKWNINTFSVPYQFDFFITRMREGFRSIKPRLDLILRHISGSLFQEAHKEVLYFNPQRDLFGGVSSNLSIKESIYTSIHYTPQFLARSIVENALNILDLTKHSLKIFDPACGSSEFLIETLKQLKNRGFSGNISIIGWDTSESAISTSIFLLNYENRTQWSNKLNISITLVEDSLCRDWDNDYDLILMNPPFVSWELLKVKIAKDAIHETLKNVLNSNGRPNQAAAFFYKSVQHIANDGVLGCLLPTSIFTFDGYKKLRKAVEEFLNIHFIAKLGNFIFEDALTDVSFFIGKKPKTLFIPRLLWSKNERGIVEDALRDLRKIQYNKEFTVDDKRYSIYQPPFFPIVADTWKIISFRENKFFEKMERLIAEDKLVRVSNIFNVKQGIRQGKKDIFKITVREFELLDDGEKKLFRPVVDNDSIKNGKLYLKKYIWYPYNENGMIFKNEEHLESVNFFQNKIKVFEDQLKLRSGINEWWGLTRPRNWQFSKYPKLVSTEFGKSDSFAFDKVGDYVVERGNAWIPKKEFCQEDFYFYLALFTSNLFENLLSIYSKQILSGWYLGKEDTKNIPIPDVHLSEVRSAFYYTKLVEYGKELEEGNVYVKPVIDEILSKYIY